MTSENDLRDAAELQSRLCTENGTPTWAAIIDALTELDFNSGNSAVELLKANEQDPTGSALHLRLLGAAQRVAMRQPGSDFGRYLPSLGGVLDPAAAVEAFFPFVETNLDLIRTEMQIPVQTNEVGRSGVLSAGLRALAAQTSLPFCLLEVGASAGLNLYPDRYRVSSGASQWGPEDSPVVLEGIVQSGNPYGRDFAVIERAGCDLMPIDASTEEGQERLKSFVWPEQTVRLRRLEAALSMIEPVRIDASPATAWVRSELAKPRQNSVAVVMHSIVMPYLSVSEKAEFAQAIGDAGRGATEDTPVAWLRMEPSEDYGTVTLELDVWPNGQHTVLATSTPHGANINWLHEQ